ncbi:hypothetical protein HYX07_02305 [Candidatus Woesearchaeota archaeon]|nr:hypothetical protein [Candidatus Woesearchaeota archaeon]
MKAKTQSIPKKPAAVRQLLFFNSFKLVKSNLGKAGYIILFDLLFLASIYILQVLSQYAAQGIFLSQNLSSVYIFIAISLIYYLIVIFSYSFFKYIVLDYINSLFEKAGFSFRRLGQFYSLNIVIAGIFFAIMILANFLLASIKLQYRPFVFIALAAPYLLFLYMITNVSHSVFYQGTSIKESLKKGFAALFTKIRVYRETILIMILFALLLWLLFYGSGYLIRLLASKNYGLYLTYYAYFKQASVILFDIVFYLIILVNRISFYSLAREVK